MRALSLRAAVLLLVVASASALPKPLPLVDLSKDTVTISGFDSGAMFATQYQFSFSDKLRGAALATPGPWACAQNTISGADVCMTSPEIVNMALFYTEAAGEAAKGNLANLTNLASHHVSILSAPLDPVVVHGTSILAENMYAKYGVTSLSTTYTFPHPATHAWITSKYGNDCSYLGPPYVNNCGVDFAGNFLTDMFRHMDVPFTPAGPNATFNSSYFFEYDQVAYGADTLKNSMDTTGFVFVPPQCRVNANGTADVQCHLHIHFHGCQQSRTAVGASYVTETEINEHAQLNNIVVLYPQAAPNDLLYNPTGCWDWFGYTNSLDLLSYATNKGVQTRIVQSIMAALLSGFA